MVAKFELYTRGIGKRRFEQVDEFTLFDFSQDLVEEIASTLGHFHLNEMFSPNTRFSVNKGTIHISGSVSDGYRAQIGKNVTLGPSLEVTLKGDKQTLVVTEKDRMITYPPHIGTQRGKYQLRIRNLEPEPSNPKISVGLMLFEHE